MQQQVPRPNVLVDKVANDDRGESASTTETIQLQSGATRTTIEADLNATIAAVLEDEAFGAWMDDARIPNDVAPTDPGGVSDGGASVASPQDQQQAPAGGAPANERTVAGGAGGGGGAVAPAPRAAQTTQAPAPASDQASAARDPGQPAVDDGAGSAATPNRQLRYRIIIDIEPPAGPAGGDSGAGSAAQS